MLVPGDVNSTLAAALVRREARRSRSATSRPGCAASTARCPRRSTAIVTDQLSELLFLHSDRGRARTCARRACATERIHFVGNTMIDTLVALRDRFRGRDASPAELGLEPGGYLLVTLHRPALVDGPLLADAMARLTEVAGELPVVFPVHPRTPEDARPALRRWRRAHAARRRSATSTSSALEADAGAVLTDSGGIQEETTYLGVPCFTLRDNTERPVTISAGTNTLLGLDPARIAEIPALLSRRARRSAADPPPSVGRQRAARARRRRHSRDW